MDLLLADAFITLLKRFVLLNMETEYLLDEVFGERLLISVKADKSELGSNIRAARAILRSYKDVSIRINSHTYAIGHKNPEYTICEELGDRKGVMSEKGITAGFKSAKKQKCKIVERLRGNWKY